MVEEKALLVENLTNCCLNMTEGNGHDGIGQYELTRLRDAIR